ncbi:MAG: GIY-YIG nuclease family protein [bacterium]
MFYTYVLMSKKNGTLYVGSTNDVKRRFEEHNKGIGGEYTRKNRPFIIIFYEAFLSKNDAQRQELFYKLGYGKEVLHEKIKDSLKMCLVV